MSWYRNGTVNVTNGSATVVGINTLWASQAREGDIFIGPDLALYEVVAVTDNTQLTIKRLNATGSYAGATLTARAYAIIQIFSGMTVADLANRLAALLNKWHLREDEIVAWQGGTATGGTNADGKYPLTTPAGIVNLVLCPAAIAATAGSAAAAAITTAADRTQTGLDRTATGQNKIATAADRTQTGLDRTAAAGSASTATAQAAIALTQAANAAASYDAFDDRYLGAKSVAPTLDNDGQPLLVGALYWDTIIPGMRAYTGAAWTTLPGATASAIANTPSGNLAAITVQAAINELDAEKAASSTLAAGGGAALVGNTPSGNLAAITVQAALNELAAEKALLAGSTAQPFAASVINAAPLLHHNDIINGDFRIAQAGAIFAAAGNGAYDLDGWQIGNVSTAVLTVAQAAGSQAGRLARQVTLTTTDTVVAAGDLVVDLTKIEGFNIEKYVGQTFTVAFRARVPVAGIHCVSLRNSTYDRSYVVEINFPTANVWQDCAFTVGGGLPTAGTWNYTNGAGLDITFVHMCGTTFRTTPGTWQTGNFLATANQVNDCATVGNVWAMEKVTLNLGTVAAVGEISFEQELIRCQRYYEQVAGISLTSRPVYNTCVYKVVKRSSPVLILFSGALGGADFNVGNASEQSFRCPNGVAATSTSDWTIAASARL